MYIGIDAGTGSIRAGAFSQKGDLAAYAELPLKTESRLGNIYEQSSRDMIEKAVQVIKRVVADSKASPSDFRALCFDATCSLVALDRGGFPFPVDPDSDDRPDMSEFNIIMWCDHRATEEAAEINKTGHETLKYLGGSVSIEHEIPKILWLKRHKKQQWEKLGQLYDLADFLTWAFSGQSARSVCTNVCKWGYLAHESGFRKDFFEAIELSDVFDRIAGEIRPLGSKAGQLNESMAERCGLSTGTVVATGIIDAHAGALGCMSGPKPEGILALIGGTSSCHMANTQNPVFVKGVWGPYYGAVIDGFWLNEGGQSSSGSLISHVVKTHPAYTVVEKSAHSGGFASIFDYLNHLVSERLGEDPMFARHVHVLPYFHGNRSPNADPNAVGVIEGLTLDASVRSLVTLYYATCEAIAYGTRHIIEAIEEARRGTSMEVDSMSIDQINLCGSHAKNPLLVQLYSDVTNKTLALMACPESMLLGTAILGMLACGDATTFFDAFSKMVHVGGLQQPSSQTAAYHDLKYALFKEMYVQQCARRHRMAQL